MSTIISLPNNHSAVLKDDDELTNKEIKTIQKSTRVAASVAKSLEDMGFVDGDPEAWRVIAEMPDDDYNSIDLFQRTCVVLRLKSWTLDQPIPTNVDEVDDLPRSIYEPLTTAAVDLNFGEQYGMEGAADPKAPTENSVN